MNTGRQSPRPCIYLKTIYVDRGFIPEYGVSLARTVAYLCKTGRMDLHIGREAYGDNAERQLNRSAHHFYFETNCTHFLIQGSDTDWDPTYWAHMAEQDASVICGLYATKNPNEIQWCFNPLAPGLPGAGVIDPVTKLEIIEKGGLECMMIRRDFFERYQIFYPEEYYDSDIAGPEYGRREWNYFGWRAVANPTPEKPDGKRRLSEDFAICHCAKEMGLEVVMDHSDFCGHWDLRTRFPIQKPELVDLVSGVTSAMPSATQENNPFSPHIE